MKATLEKKFDAHTATLMKSGAELLMEVSATKLALTHSALGIAGESGELVDAIKRHTIYGKPLDIENVVEELGDMEFYLSDLRQQLGITRDQCLGHNIKKLEHRYPDGYTNEAAIDRADKK